MKKYIFILTLIGLISLNVQAQKKAPKPEKGNALFDLKKELIKKYKYESIEIYILAGKLNIDIADVHVKFMPKNIREERSKEIADFTRTFLNTTPNGKQVLKSFTIIGINHLKKAGGGALTAPLNTYESYMF